jgi:hypothetical protein
VTGTEAIVVVGKVGWMRKCGEEEEEERRHREKTVFIYHTIGK